jgi:hypothetical protein
MPDSKISGLTEGTVVDNANDWFLYVDTSDTTQDLITGTTKKIRPSNIPVNSKAIEEMKRISFIRS